MSTSKRTVPLWVCRSCTPGSAARPVAGPARSTWIDVRVRCRMLASVPVSTARPSRMMVTRSQSASTSARMWLDSRTVRPSRCCSSRITWRKTSSISGSRPGGRLVEDEQLDVGGERGDEGDLLPVALGVGPALLARVEVEALQQLGAAPGVEAAAEPAEQVDDLAAGQVGPQRDVAGHVREAAVQFRGVAPRVAAEQPGGAGVGAQQPEQDPDGGGLPGAVGPEEAVHLPGPTDRSSPSSARVRPERLDQCVYADRLGHDGHAPSATGSVPAAVGGSVARSGAMASRAFATNSESSSGWE